MNIREPSRKRTGDPVELDVDRNTPIPGKVRAGLNCLTFINDQLDCILI